MMAYVDDPALEVRLELVKRLVEIGGRPTIDPLVQMTRDNDPEIQARATDGIVNAFLPGYVRSGITGSIRRAGDSIRAKFDDDVDDLVIDPYVEVSPEVIAALGRLTRGGTSMASRANAARALGILRGQAAVPDLIEALYTKDNDVMYQSLIALQKIRDPAAGPLAAFVVRDMEENIQIAALQLVGILRTEEAATGVRDVLARTDDDDIEREALRSLAMIGRPEEHDLFVQYLSDRDDDLRAAAAEGLARVADPADMTMLNAAYMNEGDRNPRLSIAFALVASGMRQTGEYSPLRELINTLNRSSYRGVALAFLTELTRVAAVREAIYPYLPAASRDEKTGLAIILSRSGDQATIPYLQSLANDPDPRVAEEGNRALRNMEARLP